MRMADKLILFDGVCGLCHAWIRFVVHYDKRAIFRFASVQSETGQKLMQEFKLPRDHIKTLVYVEDGVAYTKSRAFLKIIRLLPFPAKILYGLAIIPAAIRDVVYDRIASSRYRIFGRRDECDLSDGNHQDRFL